ncbi:DinB family protein [Luteococcus sp. OSA5]|uniref:DinB family protein n=1 Tax=Luteococcus sp. OSA5 TaxID=3401630 RepID=UPI003B432FC5
MSFGTGAEGSAGHCVKPSGFFNWSVAPAQSRRTAQPAPAARPRPPRRSWETQRGLMGNTMRTGCPTPSQKLARNPHLSPEALHTRPGRVGNPIAWLVWHAARQMDVQLAELTGGATVWESQDWGSRLGVDRGPDDFGLGDSPQAVSQLRVSSAQALRDHLATCTEALVDHIATLSPKDLDEIVDESWEPPVSRGVRLVSIVDDAAAHLGQAAYARGLVEDWSVGV